MRGHIDPGTLADRREGLLSRRRAARVAAHLSGCPRCAETDAQLAGVTTILASSPMPPMPAGLAGRIEAALAAEAASRAAGEAGRANGEAGESPLAGSAAGAGHGGAAGTPPAPPREHRHRPPRRSWLTPRVAAVTAAVAVIVGGGYGVATLLSNGSATGTGSSSASRPQHSVAGAGSNAAGGSRLAPSASLQRKPPEVRSGTHYQPQQLGVQARRVLARYGGPQPLPKEPANSAAPGSFGAGFVNLPACLHRVGGGRTARLVDLATYQGQQAAVIMFPASQQRVRVVVVGTGCSGAASDVLARALVPAAG